MSRSSPLPRPPHPSDASLAKREAPSRTALWLLAVLLLSLGLHALLLGPYPPQPFPDTPSYMEAASDLVTGDYRIGQGRRTPGYPSLIALAGNDPTRLMALQVAAGVLTSVLMFWMAWRLTGRAVWGFVAGAVHALNLQQLYAEAALISESYSSFSVALATAVCLAAVLRLRQGRAAFGWALLTGLVGGYALLVRPQFIFFIGLLPLLAVAASAMAGRWRAGLAAAVAMALPMVLSVLGWSAVVQAKVGPFTLSTQSGFGMMNHVYPHLEQLPDEFATARDILIRKRDARLAEVGNSRNTVWYSWPEVRKATGWSYAEASRNYQRMATFLMRAEPTAYALSVAGAWRDFWTVPNLWEPELFSDAKVRSAAEGLWRLEHPLLRLANLVFVLLSVAVLVLPGLRRRLDWDIGLTTLVAVVAASSVLQALADTGTNSRYAMPTQSLVTLVLVLAVARWWAARRQRVAPRR